MLDQKTLDYLWNQRGRAIRWQGRCEDADALHVLLIADAANPEVWMRSALDYASTAHDERIKRWMIVLLVSLGELQQGKKGLTEALGEYQLAEQWAEPLGTERQSTMARHAITECGKALAEGP